ncbi:MAG: hypothetical protein H6807_06455 [Planctomycetes bacterium]|nr:hypothetical protein [Planctomycetota bacterium]
MLRKILNVAILLVMSSAAFAQSVHLRGKIEDAENVCYYCPGYQFVIDCNYTKVTSSAYDLNLYIGTQVEIDGLWNGSTSAAAIDITNLSVVTETFAIGGNGSIGHNISFTAMTAPGDLAYTFYSFGTGFVPVGSNLYYLLDIPSSVLLGQGLTDGNGEFDVSGTLPNIPWLVGVTLYGQSAIVPANGSPIYMTNPDCKVVSL